MSFTPEDGSGIANANSYSTIAASNDYWALRGGEAWAGLSDTRKEAALIRATDWIEAAYGGSFLGVRATNAQGLAWPRLGVMVDGVAVSGVPVGVVSACCELALKATTADLAPDTDGRIVTREKVDVIETEYSAGAFNPRQSTMFNRVTQLLRPYSRGANGGMIVGLVRA